MSPGARKLRVVADTNVLFSALAFAADSPPSRILELARRGEIELFWSPAISEELERNLRAKAGWDDERLAALKRRLKDALTLVTPTVRVDVIKRVDSDNRILECALAAEADVLITGNMRDLRPIGGYHGTEIVTPREFLDTFSREEA